MRLPAYPLITVNPYFSIWSMTENLYDSDTKLWCGIVKRLTGQIIIDREQYRFLGLGKGKVIKQTNMELTPYVNTYTFETDEVKLIVSFWSPQIIDDIKLLSLPCSYIDYKCLSKDGKKHSVKIALCVGEEFCYDGTKKKVAKSKTQLNNDCCGKMGKLIQTPLSKSGDAVSCDWGYINALSENIAFDKIKRGAMKCIHIFEFDSSYECSDILAFDEIYSIELFSKKLKPLWTETFDCVEDAMIYCKDNHNELLSKVRQQEDIILSDSKEYGSAYQNILSACARQVLAAHSLVRDLKGNLLYLSKECNSNGCINTVDVTYPAIPMFLCYNPVLVKAMLTAVFDFARMTVWKYDFAPHDIGQYPLANGQVYGITDKVKRQKKRLYSYTKDAYDYESQMPVEECGNMLICCYAYYLNSNDMSQIKENFDLLTKWANYLVKTGIVLENQLCTDDFAGHVDKNVNLAIKSIMGICAYAGIIDAMGISNSNEYINIAKKYAQQLYKQSLNEDALSFSLNVKNSWSLKYNLVWDMLFDFHIFPDSLYDGESQMYRKKLQSYGVPLDYRKNFTKSDWMLWASVLDSSGKNTKIFAECIEKYLRDTDDRNCFSDWFCTDVPKEKGMNHRSVQAGLWMPVLKNKMMK